MSGIGDPQLIIGLLISIFVAVQAGRMRYSRLLWFVAAFLTNSLMAVLLLAALPDRSIRRRREQEIALLEQQLASAIVPGQAGALAIPRHTISDEATITSSNTTPAARQRIVPQLLPAQQDPAIQYEDHAATTQGARTSSSETSSAQDCTRCGTSNRNSAKFCRACGTTLP